MNYYTNSGIGMYGEMLLFFTSHRRQQHFRSAFGSSKETGSELLCSTLSSKKLDYNIIFQHDNNIKISTQPLQELSPQEHKMPTQIKQHTTNM